MIAIIVSLIIIKRKLSPTTKKINAFKSMEIREETFNTKKQQLSKIDQLIEISGINKDNTSALTNSQVGILGECFIEFLNYKRSKYLFKQICNKVNNNINKHVKKIV
jgi:hypothetical protein